MLSLMTECNRSETTTSQTISAWPGWRGLGLGLAVPFIIRFIDQLNRAGQSLLVHGLRDEAGHLLTAYVWALGLLALRVPLRLDLVLLGGIAIDIDHLLLIAGVIEAVPGSSRPGSHSLLPLVLVVMLASIDRRRAWIWLSLGVGVMSHLVRDMATGSVPLLWPLPVEPVSMRYRLYAATLVIWAMIAVGAALVNRWKMWKDVE